MATITIDGRAYEVDGEQNLLHVCLQLGLDLPYFCWHPALGSVGACRQCAVKQYRNEHDEQGQIVMACMTTAKDGTRISIDDPEVRAFRQQVIEWLMLNHPHDCPICDEGGECHLQDMTVMTGHDYRHTRFRKRTHRNQNLGPFINHEMNRCIQCYRCVRFYRDYAGGTDLDVFGAHDHVYFGRESDGALESPFAGNLVEVCPTGVFTDRTLKAHYTRKWDLQMAPSVCVHCSLGCNTTAGERYGTLRRIVNRYNGHVNGYFLCDRGRFGYEFVNHERRLRNALRREGDAQRTVTADDAVATAAELLASCDRVIGIGSPRASLEANFALRTLVGADNYFSGLSRGEARLMAAACAILRRGPVPSASLRDAERSDAVLVLGEDVMGSAPRLALTLRQAVLNEPKRGLGKVSVQSWHDRAVRDALQHEHGPLTVATPDATALDDVATDAVRLAPADIARLGFAIAHAIDGEAPAAPEIEPALQELARRVARDLVEAQAPLVVSGPSLGSEPIIQAAANVAWALRRADRPARILFAASAANSVGVTLLGGGTLENCGAAVRSAERVGVVVLDHDLTRSLPQPAADELLSAAAVVVVDCIATATSARAHAVLPAATFAEEDGTLVNNEGRAQRSFRAIPPGGDVREGWRWLAELGRAMGRGEAEAWHSVDDVLAAIEEAEPTLAGVADAAPGAGALFLGRKVPRQPARYSGRTAMQANVGVREVKPADDSDAPLAFSMEGYGGKPPSALLPYFWSPGWNSAQSLNKFQEEIAGPLRGGDPGVRLIEPEIGSRPPYFTAVPAAFRVEAGRWLLLPTFHVFGSEELSSLAPGVAALAPAPYVGLAPADAAELGLAEGADAELTVGDRTLRLRVSLREALTPGTAVVPVGVAGLPILALPARVSVRGAA